MKSKKLLVLSASLLSLLLGGSTAMAQRGGGMQMGPQQFARFQLATLPEVQSEIGLDDSMKKSATEMLEKMREEQRSLMQEGGGDRQAAMAKVNEMRKKFDEEFTGKLEAKQKSRLTGIMVQVVGAASLMDSELQTTLGISDEQKKMLTEAQAKNREASREAMQGFRDMSPEERTEKMAEMRAEADKVIMAVLTDDQKAKLEEVKGAELKVDLAPLRGRGGPGGQGGRPRRDN
ncbi:MAG: hypothetical protein MUC43_11260 [Pirellula sp.]|jgi:hypothetical protein|nr:hypothetical protein [Pirellula sp.]